MKPSPTIIHEGQIDEINAARKVGGKTSSSKKDKYLLFLISSLLCLSLTSFCAIKQIELTIKLGFIRNWSLKGIVLKIQNIVRKKDQMM